MFFREKNSLILLYDPKTREEIDEIYAQLEEVGKYYKFALLSDLVTAIEAGKSGGKVAICFKLPRKRLFQEVVPELLAKEIPSTVFIRTECVGVNRLPREEELEAYEKAYPEHQSKFQNIRTQLWQKPLEVDDFLENARKEIGPLRVDSLDAQDFFATWGKIVETPPSLFGVGLSIPTSVMAGIDYDAERKFLETQTKRPCTIAHAPTPENALKNLGFKAIVGKASGKIDKSTSLDALPVWSL